MATKFERKGDAIQLYEKVESIIGFFNYDDAQHFWLLLKMQNALGISGDLFETGTWKGRSSAFLSFFLEENEKLLLSDVFSSPATDKYPEYPSIDQVKSAICSLNPGVENRLVFYPGLSRSLNIPKQIKIRFAHIDAGHSYEECTSDLDKITPHIIVGGIVAVDDYDHPDWPEVKPATDDWLNRNPQFRPLASLNRAVAKGRKLYAVHVEDTKPSNLKKK